MKTLPFFYPKVRGFRYGYTADPEEAPEDRDDHDHDHDRDLDQDYECDQEDAVAGIEEDAQQPTRKGGDSRRTGQRLGWITLDLFLAGDESVFTDKMV